MKRLIAGTVSVTVFLVSIMALVLSVGVALSAATARGQDIFVANFSSGTIGEYTTSGATVNPSLISGLNTPIGLAVSGSNLFVTSFDAGTIGEYTTSGATVNPSLVSGLNVPYSIAVSGSNLFVVNENINGGLAWHGWRIYHVGWNGEPFPGLGVK